MGHISCGCLFCHWADHWSSIKIDLGVVEEFGVPMGTVSWERALVCGGLGGGVSYWLVRSDFCRVVKFL